MDIESFEILRDELYRALRIDDLRYVEIESKKRICRARSAAEKIYLRKQDTPATSRPPVFATSSWTPRAWTFSASEPASGSALKKGGSRVYLQYKGPGFLQNELLFRSEFSTKALPHLTLEESRHDEIRFTKTSVRQILKRFANKGMARAMRRHLGERVISRISSSPIVSLYQKDKFSVNLGKAFLEPSIDRVSAFHITPRGPYPLSTFYEYENEIKAEKAHS